MQRFEELIRPVLERGGELHHEAQPEDFGQPRGRLSMFRQCLEMLVMRYPGIGIAISGQSGALAALGLVPGTDILVGGRLFRAQLGATAEAGAVRLTFSRRL